MFSVLIPVYNHARYVASAITSALVDRAVSEVLLVDDGSKDDSAAVMQWFRSDPRVRILDNGGVNLGAHVRLNQLCRAARNEWLAVLNSDDAFVAHRFQIARQIVRGEKADLITGCLTLVNEDNRVLGQKRGPVDPEYPFPPDLADAPFSHETMLRRLLNQNYVATTSNMIFSRALFERIGGFADYKYIHDWDFAIRAFMLGRVTFTGAILSKYRLHASNTIKESGVLVDCEVVRMMTTLQEVFPALFDDPANRSALAGNRHLPAGGHAFFAGSRTLPARPATNQASRNGPNAPADAYGRRVALAYAVQLLFDEHPPAQVIRSCIPENPPGVRLFDHLTVYVPSSGPREVYKPDATGPHAGLADLLKSDPRPAILVLSGFFAVGGVERNTVEIIRHLRHKYRFLVVTFEKHTVSVGSLHHQLDDLDVPVIDLAHVVDYNQFFDSLKAIVLALRPSYAWIINGATWLVEHAAAVRMLLGNAKIIDQQVYDDQAGWIGAFWNAGILASDQFIAVNCRIRERFVRTYGIAEHKVKLIYPAIALERVLDVDEKRGRRRSLEERFGLTGEGPRIGLIGRLSQQKRVDRFIALAAARQHRTPKVCFAIVGQGPLEGQFKDDVARRQLENVRFVSYFEHASDIGACLDGLIISSDYEGLPIALLESMAMGIPFLSTDVGDVRKVSEAYGGGEVIDDWSDIDSVFETWLMNLPSLRTRLHESHDRILRDFSSDTLASEYDSLFAA